MAFKIVWSPISRDDLKDIIRFIAADNPEIAEQFGYRLMNQTDKLENFPEIGRCVPELHDPHIRELIFPPYRIIYRVTHEKQIIQIVRVWHGARGMPELA